MNGAETEVKSTKFWKYLQEAIRGSERDFTETPLELSIFLLAVPMVLEMIMESVFAIVDVLFAGRLGAYAIATIGLTESLLILLYTLAAGLSIGATATVARRIGEKNRRAAARAAVQTIALGVALGFLLGIAGYFFAPQLLELMGAQPEILAQGIGYTRMMLGGTIVILLLFLANAIFRGAGDGAVAMRSLWIANGINIVLNPCLIFGLAFFPKLGLLGAAVSTTIGRSVGALYTLSHLFMKNSRVRVIASDLKLDLPVLKVVVRLSAAGTLQVFVGEASWVVLMRILSSFGSLAVAGYTIGIRIVLLALFPSFGISNAAATLVGQSLGAGNPDRAEKAVWKTAFYNMCYLGSMGFIFIIFSNSIVRIFSTDPKIIAYGVDCLWIVSAGFLFYAYGMVFTQAFNGAGHTLTPTLINVIVFWLWEIPIAYVLAFPMGLGPEGVFISITLAFSVLAIVGGLAFKKGHWKTQSV